MTYEQFLQRAGTDERVVVATLAVLAERVGGDEAENLAAQLPRELKPMLRGAREPERFDADGFVLRVSERAGTDEDATRAGVEGVLAALGEAVTKEELDDVLSRLPRDYEPLFAAAARR